MTGGRARDRPAAGKLRHRSPGAALASVCEHSPCPGHSGEHGALCQDPDETESGTIGVLVASPAPEASQLGRIGGGQDMTSSVCSRASSA